MTPLIYGQNRAKAQQIGTIPTTMNNTFISGNVAIPLSNSMMASNPAPQQPQLPINPEKNQQVFFKKRASSSS
jgi:hypothetical protein